MAAARKVSAAAIRTVRPSLWRRWASLPMVVVLPLPLTPTMITTAGTDSISRRRSRASSTASISVWSARRASSAEVIRSSRTRVRSRSTRRSATGSPQSAPTSTWRRSSQKDSSRSRRSRTTSRTCSLKPSEARSIRRDIRRHHASRPSWLSGSVGLIPLPLRRAARERPAAARPALYEATRRSGETIVPVTSAVPASAAKRTESSELTPARSIVTP